MTDNSSIQNSIETYVAREVLQGTPASEISETTPLISSGLLDSIAIVRLVLFLEQEFGIVIDGHDITPEDFDTIETIAALVKSKCTG